MATEYDVQARLTMDAQQASRAVTSYSNRLVGLGRTIQGTQGMMGGLIGKAVALGVTYVGLTAGVRTFTNLTKSAVDYTASLQSTKIGLSSVLAAVNGLSYAAANAQAGSAFDKIKELSITSPAGPKEMFGIFQGIVGPIRAAGVGMETVYGMTANTVLAANALGVDLEQAQRDMALMARGTAGMDTKMFSIMKSMGLITESTEEWNKKLTAAERVERLNEVLQGFAASGEAFGKSYAGVTSTFKGIVNEQKRAFVSPVMATFASKLGTLNEYLIANNDNFTETLTAWGESTATVLENTIDRGVEAFKYLQSNWGAITDTWAKSMEVLKEYGPLIGKVAAGVAAVNIARGPAGAAVSAGGLAASGLIQAGAAVGGASKSVGSAGKGILGAFKGLGDFDAGEYGATAGAAVAASGGGATGGGAAGGGAAAAAGPALAPLLIALAALAALAVAVHENFYLLMGVFDGLTSSTTPLVDSIVEFGKTLWGFLKPALEVVGLILIATLIPAWQLLVWVLDTIVMPPLQLVGDMFKWVGDQLEAYVIPALRSFIGWLGALKDEASTDTSDDYKTHTMAGEGPSFGMFSDTGAEPEKEATPEKRGSRAPSKRAGTNINVDKMIIKQEFKGEKDPDRVVSMMLNDITKQAERRVSVRFTGALTR